LAKCAYCNEDKKLTREHIIPDWFLNISPSPDDVTFLERIPKKFLNTDAVIKDVCSSCNNVHLSKLDAYGKNLFDKYFQHAVFKGESIDFEFDCSLLAKWLIKVSFNSARANKTDLEVLSHYNEILISEVPLPKDILIYCTILAPSNLDDPESPVVAVRTDDCELFIPEWFRIGVFRVPEFDSINWCFRNITINCFSFCMFLPKYKSSYYLEEIPDLNKAISKAGLYGAELTNSNRKKLFPPKLDAFSSYVAHMFENPIAYEIPVDNITNTVINEDFGVVMYMIPRADIESSQTEELMSFLDTITASREVALAYKQRIEFMVEGYDNDPRELFEIPEVVSYLELLNKLFPYWMFFQSEQGLWLRVLSLCLSEGKNFRVGEVAFNQELMMENINNWFVNLNKLSHSCAISEKINRKISNDAIQLITGVSPNK